jgi:hypothetical protein
MNYSPRSSAVQEAPSAFNNEEEFAGPGRFCIVRALTVGLQRRAFAAQIA